MSLTKGMAIGQFVLAVAVIFVLTFFVTNVLEGQEKIFSEEQCRMQVQQHAAGLKFSGREFESKITKCSTNYPTINTNDEEKAMDEIAEAMRQCRYNFPNLNLFKDEHIYCHPCSVIEFKGDGDLSLLAKHMKDKKMPPPQQKLSYFDYVTGFEMSDGAARIDEMQQQVEILSEQQKKSFENIFVDLDVPYSVLLVYAKGEDKIQQVIDFMGEAHTTHLIAVGLGLGTGATVAPVLAFFVGGLSVAAAASPPGWVVAVAAGIGVAVGALWEFITFKVSDESEPEYISGILLVQHTEEALRGLNCEYEPIDI